MDARYVNALVVGDKAAVRDGAEDVAVVFHAAYLQLDQAIVNEDPRILGVQLYKYDIKGFLQWAFNFYYTVLSKKLANPFQTADAYGQIPAGSAYMVYPGEDGPIESIRGPSPRRSWPHGP